MVRQWNHNASYQLAWLNARIQAGAYYNIYIHVAQRWGGGKPHYTPPARSDSKAHTRAESHNLSMIHPSIHPSASVGFLASLQFRLHLY